MSFEETPSLREEIATPTQQEIVRLHQEGEYRPVGVAAVFNKVGEVLVIKSAMSGGWLLPQGGIEMNEDIKRGVVRELTEEITSLKQEELKVSCFVGSKRIDAPPNRTDTRGFTKGKAYFGFGVKYTGQEPLQWNTDEVMEARWVAGSELEILLEGKRPEKKEMLLEMLQKSKEYLSHE